MVMVPSSRSVVALEAVGVESVAVQAVFRDTESDLPLCIAHLDGGADPTQAWTIRYTRLEIEIERVSIFTQNNNKNGTSKKTALLIHTEQSTCT